MWSLVGEGLQRALREHAEVAAATPQLEAGVEWQLLTSAAVVRRILATFLSGR